MSTVEQTDRVLSTSQDPLPCIRSSRADHLIRTRPLSDIYPFHNHADNSAAPFLLSGCGTQVQPMTAGPDENRLNGLNSSAWSHPVIGQPEGKPYSSRIMKLFSNSKKGPVPAHSPTTDPSTSSQGNNSGPQSWPGLSGLGVVDSFKKLRSSVLQGIQSRGGVTNDGEHSPSWNQEAANGTDVDNATHHLKFAEGYSEANGNLTVQRLGLMTQSGSDTEDYDEEETGDGLTRNTRFSRSIRRAYGAGRISLLDVGNGKLAGRSPHEATGAHKPDQTSKENVESEKVDRNTNVKVLSRLSKSADNLHIFKAPFRRKAPPPGTPSPKEDHQRTTNGTPTIQRTASASSVDLRGHAGSHRKSPLKTKGSMLKLVGSMTDLTVRRKRSPSPSPTSPTLMSPLSRLHDDYSRRLPFLATSERQRRPSPVRARVLTVEHTPLVHPQPENAADPQLQHEALISPVSVEPPERKGPTYESPTEDTTTETETNSAALGWKEPSQQPEQTEVDTPPTEVRE